MSRIGGMARSLSKDTFDDEHIIGDPILQINPEDLDDSDNDGIRKPEKKAGRRKIKIEYIADKSRRHITFSKRKAGIMKKAQIRSFRPTSCQH
jgi:hypothetical protein